MQKPYGLRVLMVGDHGPLAEPLRGEGHEVIVVPDAPAATDAARVVLDVVVLDLDQPGIDVAGLADAIRRRAFWRKPMFIALARHGGAGPEKRCKEAGLDLLLVKPVAPDLLMGFLGRLQAVVQDLESFDPMI